MQKQTKFKSYFKYKKMSVGIVQKQNCYTFFVLDNNVTWHSGILFKTIESLEIAAKQYVDNILQQRN